jgi:hypothetical protein
MESIRALIFSVLLFPCGSLLTIVSIPAASFASSPSVPFSGVSSSDQATKSPAQSDENIVIQNHIGQITKDNPKGGFVVDKVTGNVELRANGSITIGLVEGNINAVTTAGDVKVEDVQGTVTAVTQVGNITIQIALKHVFAQVEIGEIIVHSAPTVEVRNIFGGDVKILGVTKWAKVVTKGNIVAVLNVVPNSSEICNLSSTEGDITLYLPDNLGADIEIRMPLSGDPKRETRVVSAFTLKKFMQKCDIDSILTLSTTINNGGDKINLYIEKGNVFIKKIKTEREK